jgi:membrane protein
MRLISSDHRTTRSPDLPILRRKLGGLTVLQLGKRVWHEILQDEVLTRSAALSYYFFSALIPMVFFLTAILGIFAGQSEHLRASLLNYFAKLMPQAALTLVEKALGEISRNSSGIKLVFGLVLSLWVGAGGVSSIIDALNHCYHIKDSRPYWKRQLLSLGLTVALAALTVCALAIVLYGGDIAEFVGQHTGLSNITLLAWKVLQWPVALFFVIYALALIYYWGPDARHDWQWITPGSMVALVTWIAASVLFRVYLHFYNSYSKSYGSLGAVMVLLLWLYITGLAILVGGEINSEIENAATGGDHPEDKEAGEKVT